MDFAQVNLSILYKNARRTPSETAQRALQIPAISAGNPHFSRAGSRGGGPAFPRIGGCFFPKGNKIEQPLPPVLANKPRDEFCICCQFLRILWLAKEKAGDGGTAPAKQEEDSMKATGIVRRIDDLGRVVIPKEIRRTMRIREGDPTLTTLTRQEQIFSGILRWARRLGAEMPARPPR